MFFLLILILILSLTPHGDEFYIEQTATCSDDQAKMCLPAWLDCRIAPSHEIPMGAKIILKNQCRSNYYQKCSSCGLPKLIECRTYWDRLQKNGPVILKLMPGAESFWSTKFGQEANCKLVDLE